MRRLRQIVHEASGGVAVALAEPFCVGPFQGANGGERMNLQSRRALLKQFAPQYREASSDQKRVLLDTFAQATGYHRGSGM